MKTSVLNITYTKTATDLRHYHYCPNHHSCIQIKEERLIRQNPDPMAETFKKLLKTLPSLRAKNFSMTMFHGLSGNALFIFHSEHGQNIEMSLRHCAPEGALDSPQCEDAPLRPVVIGVMMRIFSRASAWAGVLKTVLQEEMVQSQSTKNTHHCCWSAGCCSALGEPAWRCSVLLQGAGEMHLSAESTDQVLGEGEPLFWPKVVSQNQKINAPI